MIHLNIGKSFNNLGSSILYVVQCRLAGKDLFHLLLAVLMLDDFQNKPGRGAELLKICDIGR